MRFLNVLYALVPFIAGLITDSIRKSAKKGAPIAGSFASACPPGEQTEKCRLQANKFPLGIGGRLFNPRPAMERGSLCYKPKGQALEVQATTACCGSVSSGMHLEGLCVGLQTNVVGCSQFHRCCRLEYGSDNKDYDACI